MNPKILSKIIDPRSRYQIPDNFIVKKNNQSTNLNGKVTPNLIDQKTSDSFINVFDINSIDQFAKYHEKKPCIRIHKNPSMKKIEDSCNSTIKRRMKIGFNEAVAKDKRDCDLNLLNKNQFSTKKYKSVQNLTKTLDNSSYEFEDKFCNMKPKRLSSANENLSITSFKDVNEFYYKEKYSSFERHKDLTNDASIERQFASKVTSNNHILESKVFFAKNSSTEKQPLNKILEYKTHKRNNTCVENPNKNFLDIKSNKIPTMIAKNSFKYNIPSKKINQKFSQFSTTNSGSSALNDFQQNDSNIFKSDRQIPISENFFKLDKESIFNKGFKRKFSKQCSNSIPSNNCLKMNLNNAFSSKILNLKQSKISTNFRKESQNNTKNNQKFPKTRKSSINFIKSSFNIFTKQENQIQENPKIEKTDQSFIIEGSQSLDQSNTNFLSNKTFRGRITKNLSFQDRLISQYEIDKIPDIDSISKTKKRLQKKTTLKMEQIP